ncbi:MAG: hypothetical protein NTW25_06710, partial [Candidatus Kapabacteria bacterium]|nr:hypothetical protein [Candidatus Kapabacteria bacterium]
LNQKDNNMSFYYRVKINYSKNNIQKYFILLFNKLDNDDYYFVNGEIQPEDDNDDSFDTP